MGTGGKIGRRVGLLVGAGCVTLAVAVFAVASGTLSGGHQRTASIGQGPATTAGTTDPNPDVAVPPASPGTPGADPQGTSEASGSDPSPAVATAPAAPTAPLPTAVEQMLSELATQLEQAGGGGGGGGGGEPQTLTREEVDALVTAQLRALGIEL